MKLSHGQNMDTLGFEPRAFRMRSGCDTTTPCAHLIASQEHTAIWQKNEKGVHECKPEEERERERERERQRKKGCNRSCRIFNMEKQMWEWPKESMPRPGIEPGTFRSSV